MYISINYETFLCLFNLKNGSVFNVLRTIITHMDDNQKCNLKREEIAARTHLSVATVSRAIAELKNLAIIVNNYNINDNLIKRVK